MREPRTGLPIQSTLFPVDYIISTAPADVCGYLLCRQLTRDEYALACRYNDKLSSEWMLTNHSIRPDYSLAERTTYRNTVKERTESASPINFPNVHWGQLKLLMNEIEFLAFAQRTISYKCLLDYVVLYVGAADGQHIVLLSNMFPEATIECWDPRDYHPELIAHSKRAKHEDGRAKVILNTGYFTDEIAATYSDRLLLFMCDIRTTPERQGKHTTETATEARVRLKNTDHEMQQRWVTIMQPHIAMLKFAPLYGEGMIDYFSGPIRTQPFMPVASTEARLFVFPGMPLTRYSCLEYEEIANHHNLIVRQNYINMKIPFPSTWTSFTDSAMRYDDWRSLDILRVFTLTRAVMEQDIEPLPLSYASFDRIHGENTVEAWHVAVELLGKIQRALGGNQRDKFISRLNIRTAEA